MNSTHGVREVRFLTASWLLLLVVAVVVRVVSSSNAASSSPFVGTSVINQRRPTLFHTSGNRNKNLPSFVALELLRGGDEHSDAVADDASTAGDNSTSDKEDSVSEDDAASLDTSAAAETATVDASVVDSSMTFTVTEEEATVPDVQQQEEDTAETTTEVVKEVDEEEPHEEEDDEDEQAVETVPEVDVDESVDQDDISIEVTEIEEVVEEDEDDEEEEAETVVVEPIVDETIAAVDEEETATTTETKKMKKKKKSKKSKKPSSKTKEEEELSVETESTPIAALVEKLPLDSLTNIDISEYMEIGLDYASKAMTVVTKHVGKYAKICSLWYIEACKRAYYAAVDPPEKNDAVIGWFSNDNEFDDMSIKQKIGATFKKYTKKTFKMAKRSTLAFWNIEASDDSKDNDEESKLIKSLPSFLKPFQKAAKEEGIDLKERKRRRIKRKKKKSSSSAGSSSSSTSSSSSNSMSSTATNMLSAVSEKKDEMVAKLTNTSKKVDPEQSPERLREKKIIKIFNKVAKIAIMASLAYVSYNAIVTNGGGSITDALKNLIPSSISSRIVSVLPSLLFWRKTKPEKTNSFAAV